jgi:predicted KAP-like P-loop ATPase
MTNTDKPINQISEDKLGRSTFAKQLANVIVNFQTKDNYAVSLQGKWGFSGKKSLKNKPLSSDTSVGNGDFCTLSIFDERK